MNMLNIEQLDFEKSGGLVPAIIQDGETKAVLMLGFMNEEALKRTIESRKVTFWSRTRQKLWEKGETSGNSLEVLSIAADCDNDTLLILAKPKGPTCHTGDYSCFGTEQGQGLLFLQQLYDLIAARKKDLPEDSYTTFLFKKGLGKIVGKVAEESCEVIQAAEIETRQRLIEESSDLLYHLFVLLVQKEVSLGDVIQELYSRSR